MHPLPKTVSIRDLSRRQEEVLLMAQNTPVVLTAHSQPAGVLISPAQWDETANELQRLKQQVTKMEGLIQAMKIRNQIETGQAKTRSLDELCAKLNVV